MQSLQQSLAKETHQRQLVERRFHHLADNHQQMIRLKDEYKEEAKRLREEVEGGGEGSQEQLEEQVRREMELEMEEKVRREVEESVRRLEQRATEMEGQCEEAQGKVKEMEIKMKMMMKEHTDSLQHLQTHLKGQYLGLHQTLSPCAPHLSLPCCCARAPPLGPSPCYICTSPLGPSLVNPLHMCTTLSRHPAAHAHHP